MKKIDVDNVQAADADVVKICEQLYKFAKLKGKRTTSYDSERSEGEDVGFGSRHDRTHYNLEDGLFTIKATRDCWVCWGPTYDRDGTTLKLEVFYKYKAVFTAAYDDHIRTKQFTGGDERYIGSQNQNAVSWHITTGELKNLPVKYLII